MGHWKDIVDNFNLLMDDHINASGSCSTVFKEEPVQIDLDEVPASSLNGSYSVIYQGENIPVVSYNQNIDYLVNTRLEVAFLITDKVTYNQALDDIHTIINKRLTPETWANSTIGLVDLNSVSKPRFTTNNTGTCMIVDIDFQIQARDNQ